MKKGGGIILLSMPFAAGVAAVQLIAHHTAAARTLCAACALLLVICASSRKDCRPLLMLLFFCLGGLCRCTEALSIVPERIPPPSRAMDIIAERIAMAGFPGEHSGAIVTALLTGRRGALPRSTIQAFRASGASHILALSGLHLGVIYLFTRRLLAPAGNTPAARWLRGTLSVLLCGLYTLLTGASPSTVRAFLFIAINETGRAISGRSGSPAATFSLALMVQLAFRPSLVESAGFQLSYLAMLGIILIYKPMSSWYPGRRGILKSIWNAAALSTSCQLFTAPAAWWHFRALPRYYLITNLLALPLTEGIIISALACLMLDAIGICPQALREACGGMVRLLEFCLEVISTL